MGATGNRTPLGMTGGILASPHGYLFLLDLEFHDIEGVLDDFQDIIIKNLKLQVIYWLKAIAFT